MSTSIIAEALLFELATSAALPHCDGCGGTNKLQPTIRLTGLTSLVYLCAICAVNLAASIEAQITLKRKFMQDAEDRKI